MDWLYNLAGLPGLPAILTATGMWRCIACGPPIANGFSDCTEELEFADFKYQPVNHCNPCNGGGYLTADYPGDSDPAYIVPYDYVAVATEFYEGDPGTGPVACNCFFPAGLIPGIDMPVFVEVEGGKDCSGGSTTDPPDPVVLGCEGEMIFEEVEPCYYNIYCITEDGTEVLENQFIGGVICVESDGACIWICPSSMEPITEPPVPLPPISDVECDEAEDNGWWCESLLTGGGNGSRGLRQNWEIMGFGNFNEETVSVKTDSFIPAIKIIDAFPNPFRDGLDLRLGLESRLDLSIRIVNVIGTTILEKDLGEFPPGIHLYPIHDLSSLAPGVYQICVSNENVTPSWVQVVKVK